MSIEKLLAARDLLESTKRNLQLVDDEIAVIKAGRAAVQPAHDVSSEHRTAWFSVVDDLDGEPGIRVQTTAANVGFGTAWTGTIRVQEDAAFVAQRILVAVASPLSPREGVFIFSENLAIAGPLMCALKDGNTGRNLTPGISTGPVDQDRGAVPLTVLSSFRNGLGASYKNSMFSEFVVPRAGTIKVTIWNMRVDTPAQIKRVHVSLLGYKVFGA